MWQIVAFIVGSAALVYVSRKSLLRPRSHGFYRFFAWELLLALSLLNFSTWFTNWAAWYQLISWILLIACFVPLILGIAALRGRGQPDAQRRSEPQLIAFEPTTQLVTDGIYGYIRHPLYSSLFLLGWGIFFKSPSLLDLALALATSLFLVATSRADEAECRAVFGSEYTRYMQRTRMFIPYVF